jgi:hypothetical protein
MNNKYKKLTLSTKIPFGKYKEELVFDVIKDDPDYIQWLSTKWEGEIDFKVTSLLKELLDIPDTPGPKEVKYLPSTNIPIPPPVHKTTNIEGLPILVLKDFLMFRKDQEIYFNDLFRSFTTYLIGELFHRNYIEIKK